MFREIILKDTLSEEQSRAKLLLLKAFAKGAVYYDPGIKLENASSDKPKNKRRSQFRIASKDLGALYKVIDLVRV